jgi:hypothetical protein
VDDGADKVQALTTLSPIRPERLRDLQRRLAVVRYTPGLGRPLLNLGFIHYARWAIIDALPDPTGRGGRIGLRSRHLLFQGIYDGDQDDYLDVFSEVIPSRIAAIWHACVGFEENVERVPAARDRTIAPAAFREFVRANQLTGLGLYLAYPETATAVRQAILMRERLDDAADTAPDDTAEAYRRIGSMAVGPIPERGDLRERARAVYDPWRRALRGKYGVNPLTLAIPDPDGALAAAVRADSELSWLTGTETHYARVCAIHRRTEDPGSRPAEDFGADYLLVTIDYHGDRWTLVETLRERLLAAGLGAHRPDIGFPGADGAARFHAWVDDHALPTNYYVAGYPPRSVGEITRLLGRRTDVAKRYRAAAYPTGDQIVKTFEGRRP